ncbi:cutinase-domain-containing protein [Coniella lustricola]|uniref:Cutinase n=1 Tax=Coniella lustricola TaxID=2025994 RepID=A0A2T2ZRM5_9PEZI|nr:cutinase-domain-containing protein [Coniella lustricola]
MKSFTTTATLLLFPLLALRACASPITTAVPTIASTTTTSTTALLPRLSVNSILALISELFPASIALSASATLIEAEDTLLADALGYTTTYNQLTSSGATCGDVTLIFARGTDEPGNVGALVGPEFYAALQTAVGAATTVRFQGVNDYAASVTEYLEGGSTEGATNMASLVTQAFSQCPDTQVVMSGYSQGAQVVHLAAAALPAATMEKVSAVVTFGDPGMFFFFFFFCSSFLLFHTWDGDHKVENTPNQPPDQLTGYYLCSRSPKENHRQRHGSGQH